MLLGIDHLVIAVADPDAGVATLANHLGLEPGGGGTHDAWGTRNRILWLGDSYVELLGVDDPVRATRSWLGGPALAARARWPTLVGWAIATDDLVRDAEALRRRGATLGEPILGERRRADGQTVRWRLALPPQLSLAAPFLIEHPSSSAEWTPEDRAHREALPGRLLGLALPVDVIVGLEPGAAMVGRQRVAATGPARAAGAATAPEVRITSPAGFGRTTLLGCDLVVD